MNRILLVLGFIGGIIVGAGAFAIVGSKLTEQPGWDFVGALASIVVWLLTYREGLSARRKEERALVAAPWADTVALQDVLYREAEWWREASKVTRLGTQQRIMGHLDTPVFNANLHRIGELSIVASDAMLTVRAGVIALRELIGVFYDLEDKMTRGPSLAGETDAAKGATAQKNKMQIFRDMMDTAARARIAARLLDPSGKLADERRAVLLKGSNPDWLKQLDQADAVLDKIAASNPARF